MSIHTPIQQRQIILGKTLRTFALTLLRGAFKKATVLRKVVLSFPQHTL